MRPNYEPWEVRIEDFPRNGTEREKLAFLIRFALLAPSGHNTQPWRFSISGSSVSLHVDVERSLEGSDPKRHQLFLAFGCAIQNLCVAGRHYGLKELVSYFPDPHDPDHIASISFREDRSVIPSAADDLITAILTRHTNRSKYSKKPIPKPFENFMVSLSKKDLSVTAITDPATLRRVADITNGAQVEIMDSRKFREELSGYIRSSFTRATTGMPGFVLEIPAPVSVFASALIKRVNLSRASMKKDEELLKQHTPAVVVIASRRDDAESWIDAGRLFEEIWLRATHEGLTCSPLAAAIQSTRHSAELRTAIGTSFVPNVLFRIGYADTRMRHTPRMSLVHVLEPPRS